jgi:threonine dehydratase
MPVRPGDLTFAHVRAFVDAVVTVEDAAIAAAVLWIFAHAKVVSEPSGAAATAAVLAGAVDAVVPAGLPIVAIVSGGNMSVETLHEMEQRAAADRAEARPQPGSPGREQYVD